MRVIPAIDLKGGRCVRLLRGDFDRETEYAGDPLEIAERYAAFDVGELHVVDLDGARTGAQANADAIDRITGQSPFAVQLGGGIRGRDTVQRWLSRGVSRVVIGSIAVSDPDTVGAWLDEFGADRIVLAFDVTIDGGTPYVATHGWTQKTRRTLWDCIDGYLGVGLVHLLCTDIGRDGAMTGPNVALYSDIIERYPQLELQASGGIRHAQDLSELKARGVPAAITGKALLDGRITADEVATFRRSA